MFFTVLKPAASLYADRDPKNKAGRQAACFLQKQSREYCFFKNIWYNKIIGAKKQRKTNKKLQPFRFFVSVLTKAFKEVKTNV